MIQPPAMDGIFLGKVYDPSITRLISAVGLGVGRRVHRVLTMAHCLWQDISLMGVDNVGRNSRSDPILLCLLRVGHRELHG